MEENKRKLYIQLYLCYELLSIFISFSYFSIVKISYLIIPMIDLLGKMR